MISRCISYRAYALVLALCFAFPGRALAQSAEGMIVSMDERFAVIDLGSTSGVAAGDLVEVWRPIRLKHPGTGQMIADRFRIGTLRVTQARAKVSVARVEGDVDRAFLQGDVIVAVHGPPPVAAPPVAPPQPVVVPTVTTTTTTTKTASPEATRQTARTDQDSKELDELFRSLRGAPPEKRIGAYERYVLEHPQSRHVEVLWDEAHALKRLAEHDRMEGERAAKRPRTVSFDPPKIAPAGVALTIGMELTTGRGALMHFRREGASTFTTAPMDKAGLGYFAGTVPSSMMREGTLEYFVESTAEGGEVWPVAGTASSPLALVVEDPVPPDSRAPAAEAPSIVTASVLTDYASFNSKKANDLVWQSEAQLGVRMRDEGLRAVRSGFGVYRGKGGTLAELEIENRQPRRVGLTYGYLEGELAIVSSFAFVGRAIVGLRESGVNGGAQAFVRIGNDRKTNLLVGGEALGGIGIRGITQLEWNSFPRIPILIRSEVTNQPAGISTETGWPLAATGRGEVGVRSIVQVGYRIVPRLVVAGRFSFQARTINHAGPGVGAAVMYEW